MNFHISKILCRNYPKSNNNQRKMKLDKNLPDLYKKDSDRLVITYRSVLSFRTES